jgi:hypothetical protein
MLDTGFWISPSAPWQSGRKTYRFVASSIEHPRLIERPVAVSGKRAVLGRPTEKVLELI